MCRRAGRHGRCLRSKALGEWRERRGQRDLGGPPGPRGIRAAPGLQGPPVAFQGTWSNAATYTTGDTVFYNGSSYISLSTGNIGNSPTNGTPWSLLAQQGTTGQSGIQ